MHRVAIPTAAEDVSTMTLSTHTLSTETAPMTDDVTRATTLDARDPYVLDTRPLGRRPGAMRRETPAVPAPADMRIGMIGVQPDTPIELDLRLEGVMEGVLVSGRARVTLSGECARCLDELSSRLEVELQELYLYPESEGSGEDDELRLDGELLNLEPVVRSAVVLALPPSPLCRPDCPGLCARCGVRLADAEPGHSHEDPVDPRWQALRGLLTNADTNTDANTDNQES